MAALPAQRPESQFLHQLIWTYKSKPQIKRQTGDHAGAFIGVFLVLVTVTAEKIRTQVSKNLVASL